MTQREKYYLDMFWVVRNLSHQTFGGIEREDLEQVLAQTLWTAIDAWVDAKKQKRKVGPLAKYLYASCKNRKVSYIRTHLAKKNAQNIPLETVHESVLPSVVYTIRIEVRHQKIIIDGKDILKTEPSILRRRVFYHSVIGYSYLEIAKKFELSVSDVKRYIFELRKKLRKENDWE